MTAIKPTCGACRDGACPIISGDGEHQGHVCISTDENCTQHVCACGEEWGDLL